MWTLALLLQFFAAFLISCLFADIIVWHFEFQLYSRNWLILWKYTFFSNLSDFFESNYQNHAKVNVLSPKLPKNPQKCRNLKLFLARFQFEIKVTRSIENSKMSPPFDWSSLKTWDCIFDMTRVVKRIELFFC